MELEHRTSKARYKRTDKREFVRQLARIERHEARLRRIRVRLFQTGQIGETVATTLPEHHHIGASQNQFEHIGTFLQRNSGDPAVNEFLPKLQRHLLPRILSSLYPNTNTMNLHAEVDSLPDLSQCSSHSLLFKYDRMYKHNIIRVNYTTYDVRRSQEVANASTSHCNIMVLNDTEDEAHPFRYARVLGIYHVNVVYVGPGMVDHRPRRLEFLWVRWYQRTAVLNTGWGARKLDTVQFPPVTSDEAFGFVDPSEVLRCCHIVPAFAQGKVHIDGRGRSRCARDSSDWRTYYINR
jgi:hypothetical protein